MKKYFLYSLPIFIFGAIIFTFAALHVTKPAYAASCLVNPTSRVAGENFNVGGLGFDPATGFHSVSMTGFFPTPENTFNNLALMSYDPATGAWSATVTVPSTAPSGDYIVRVDSTQCYPNLSVTASSTTSKGCTLNVSSALPGEQVTITSVNGGEGALRIAKAGDTTGSTDLNAYLTPSGTPEGGFALVTLPGGLTQGDWTIRAIVGAFNVITCTPNITIKSNADTYIVAWQTPDCNWTCPDKGTSTTLTTTNYRITVPTTGTTYEVFVCKPDCGTGTALPGFNPKVCVSGAGGVIYVDWLTNFCGENSPSYVECSGFVNCVTSFAAPGGYSSDGFIGTIISRFLPIAIAFGGFLTVIFIVISGIQFITSSGNPDAAAAARGRLTFAIVGFVLLVLAFMLTKLVDMVLLRGSGIFQ